ncbi:MAG: NifU family protein [Clostridiales Family XIII bacterium]|jgi:Fe-S cluster biogenesis protein NfuA|nr:NifU family protein [Clostridiales Family XIII bacterium]
MEARVREILAGKVNPLLKSHDGGVELVKFEDGVAHVRLTGACRGCPSAQYTVEEVIKTIMAEELPDVRDIALEDSVSQELIDMAKKILSGESKLN